MDCRLRCCNFFFCYLTSLDVGLANHIHADCYLRITPYDLFTAYLAIFFTTIIGLFPDYMIASRFFESFRLLRTYFGCLPWSIATYWVVWTHFFLRIFLRILVTFNAKSWVSSIATQGEMMTSLVIVLLTSEKLTTLVDIFHTLDCILNRMIISTDFPHGYLFGYGLRFYGFIFLLLHLWMHGLLRVYLQDIFLDSDFSLHFTRDYLFRSRSSEFSYGLVYLVISLWFLLDLYGSVWIYIGFFVISRLFYFFLFRTSIEIGGVSRFDISYAITKVVSAKWCILASSVCSLFPTRLLVVFG